MRFFRAILSAVVATLPVLVILLIPAALTVFGGTLLNAAFVAAIILGPKVNGWLDPQVPEWTSENAMAETGRVWRTRIWMALLAVLALLAVFAAGQTAALLVGQGAPAMVDGELDYSRFLAQEITVYLIGYVLSLAVYLSIIRLLARSRA